jgi:hypothetical protein
MQVLMHCRPEARVRDVMVVVAQRGRTRLGWGGRWTLLPAEWHYKNVLLVAVAIGRGLLVSDGRDGLRMTRAGRRWMNGRT